MTVEEFKFIYFWEWGHRMWGRALGERLRAGSLHRDPARHAAGACNVLQAPLRAWLHAVSTRLAPTAPDTHKTAPCPALPLLTHTHPCAAGLVVALPAAYFASRGMINGALGRRLALLFLMGGTQGLVGWWMVRSGFRVSPA